ncbi:MAG: NusA-like transcription termination signal-binding factor [Candidatus Hydrothermarchaeaceae archaeon]
MMTVKLSADEIRYMALLEKITGAISRDCIVDEKENTIVFVVNKGDMGLAIGRKGTKIQRVKQSLGKRVEVIEYSDDPAEFARNLFHPFRVTDVSVQEQDKNKVALVEIDARDKDRAKGRKGKNLQKARTLSLRHHGVDIKMV